MGEIRAVLDSIPGISYAFSQPIDMRVQEMIIGARGDVVVKIFGDDIDELNRLTRDVAASLRKITGSRDVFAPAERRHALSHGARRPARRRPLRPQRRRDSGRACASGSTASQVGIVLEGPIRTPLVIRGAETSRRSAVDFARLPMVSSEGKVVELSQTRRRARRERPDPGHSRGRPALRHRARQCDGARSRRLRRRGQSRGRQERARRRRDIAINGAASSKTSSAPRRGSRSSCRSRWR